MIMLLSASALTLAALQASIAAPTKDFRGCLHDAVAKATSEKVAAATIEDYLRGACSAQMGSLKDALVEFRMKNGMGKKAAVDDAQMTIDDYVASPADNYRFTAEQNAPKPQPAAAPAAPPPQQQASSQPQGG
jgi:hypothetical protein